MSWENDPGRGPRPIGESLEKLVRSMGAPSVSALDKIFGNWERIVGKDVASHSRPTRLEDGELTVAVDSGVWASQLRWMTGEVLQAVSREAGEGVVSALRVKVSTPPK